MTRPPASASPAGGKRLFALARRHKRAVEAVAVTAAAFVFLISVLPNLANHPAITDDEVWVMSAAFKLGSESVFGSDMFAGFYHADRAYLFNMPAHSFVVAAAFRVLGAGVLQARLVGVAYGLATLILTYLLARRIYGVAAAIVALGLLLFLRLNMGFDTGLPLQELSASIRYDLAPVPFMLAGFLLLLGGDSAGRAVGAGALFGLATLFQFYGVFALMPAVVFLLIEVRAKHAGQTEVWYWVSGARMAAALICGAVLVCLPYGAYILTHYEDFRGQAGTVDRRDDFGTPAFYVESVRREPDRFARPLGFKEVPKGEDPRLVEPRYLSVGETVRRRPSAKLGLIAGMPVALGFSGWLAWHERRRPDRLLFLLLAGLPVQYALFEALKLYVYWIPVVPLLCVALAPALLGLLRPPRRNRLRLAAAVITVACLLLALAEGSAARLNGLRTAGAETDYGALGRQLHELVPSGSRVVGSTSLWWALRDTEYRSYFLFFYLTAPNARQYRTSISGFLADFNPDYLVLTRLGVEELEKHLVPGDRSDYAGYLSRNATLVRRLEGGDAHSYGYVEVWRFDRGGE